MAIYSYQELQEKISKCNNNDLYNRICKNIKKLRKEKYKEFKNIAALLDYNHTHYKRFESDNDSTKKIPLKKIVLLSIILDTSIEDLMK